MKNKENKIDWMLVASTILIMVLIFMTGCFAGLGNWPYAICNTLWAFCAFLSLRTYLNKEKYLRMIIERDNIIDTLISAIKNAIDKSNENEENPAKRSSAEINEETEMVHNAEGVGDE